MAAPGHPERTDGWSQTSSETQRFVDLDQGSLLRSDAGIDALGCELLRLVPHNYRPHRTLSSSSAARHRSASAGF